MQVFLTKQTISPSIDDLHGHESNFKQKRKTFCDTSFSDVIFSACSQKKAVMFKRVITNFLLSDPHQKLKGSILGRDPSSI